MIRIHSPRSGTEYQAALALQNAFLASFPATAANDDYELDIFCPLYTPGQKRKEIDLVVAGYWKKTRPKVTLPEDIYFTNYSGADVCYKAGTQVEFLSLCCTVEVKTTPVVDFKDTHIWITYRDGSKTEAVKQSHDQRDSLTNYLRTIKSPHVPMVTNLIWLRDPLDNPIPPRFRNVLGDTATFTDFLITTIQQSPDRLWTTKWGSTQFNACFKNAEDILAVRNHLVSHTQLKATPLDRKRLNRLTEGHIDTKWRTHVGAKEVVLTGRGGSGKTFSLLKTALELYEQPNKVLILTYNHALVSDIQRQLILLGISTDAVGQSIRVQNIHKFLLDLGGVWDFKLPRLRDFDIEYAELLDDFKKRLTDGAITRDDISNTLFTDRSLDYRWDYIFIDEGQDWEDAERDILFHIYRRAHMLISCGQDQLVRSDDPCDWCVGDESLWHKQPLTKCLRMGTNLAAFTTRVAEKLDVSTWKIKEQAEMPGGSIEVIVGDYFNSPEIHQRIIRDNSADGDFPIDMLYCFPAELSVRGNVNNAADAIAFIRNEWKTAVWDGNDDDERKTIAWLQEQIRVVPYESSRGLEGSTVVCLAIDRWFSQRVEMWKPKPRKGEQVQLKIADDAAAISSARNWLMIPLTRPISRLVLHLENPRSDVG